MKVNIYFKHQIKDYLRSLPPNVSCPVLTGEAE